MTRSELERKVRQHSGDIDELYRLVAGVDKKVDTLSATMDRRFDAIDGRLDAIDGRLDGMDRRFDSVDTQLSEILRRLPAA